MTIYCSWFFFIDTHLLGEAHCTTNVVINNTRVLRINAKGGIFTSSITSISKAASIMDFIIDGEIENLVEDINETDRCVDEDIRAAVQIRIREALVLSSRPRWSLIDSGFESAALRVVLVLEDMIVSGVVIVSGDEIGLELRTMSGVVEALSNRKLLTGGLIAGAVLMFVSKAPAVTDIGATVFDAWVFPAPEAFGAVIVGM